MKPLLLLLITLSVLACKDPKNEDTPTLKPMETAHNTRDSLANNFGQASMLIRKPVTDVFDAFIDPEKTSKFWFTKSSGKLEEGKSVDWIWEMYQISVPVTVIKIVENERIQIEWGEGNSLSQVVWTFETIDANKTFVTIIHSGLQGEGDVLINAIRDSTGGFTLVLAGLKAYVEHGIELNLIHDKSNMHKK